MSKKLSKLRSLPACLIGVSAATAIIVGLVRAEAYFEERRIDKVKKQDRNLTCVLDTVLEQEADDCPNGVLRLRQFDTENFTESQRRQWNCAMGQLHQRYLEEAGPENREYYLETAEKYYRRALEGGPSRVEEAAVRHRLAETAMLAGDWKLAMDTLKALSQSADCPEKEAWQCRLQTVECLVALGRCRESVDELDLLLAGCQNREIRCRALIMKAGILRNMIAGTGTNPSEAGRQGDEEQVSDFEYAQIKDSFEAALDELPAPDKRRAGLMNQLLEICVDREDSDGAYELFDRLREPFQPMDQRVRSLELIADLEARLENLDDARATLEFCIQQYPVSDRIVPVYFRLYRMYRDEKRWAEALGVLNDVHSKIEFPSDALYILEEFTEERSDLLAGIRDLSRASDYFQRMKTLAHSMDRPGEPDWQQVHDRVLYLDLLLHCLSGDFVAFETAQQVYLKEVSPDCLDEQVMFYSVMSAVRLESSPAVVAYRAERYLSGYAESPHSKEIMMCLVKAYFQMGLYQPALDTAKVVFVGEMVRMGKEEAISLKREWPRMLAIIAQCHARLGNGEIANRLFGRFITEFPRDYAGAVDVYLDWADTALVAGQNQEAMRRLQLGAGKRRDPRLDVGINVIALKLGLPGAEQKALRYLRTLHGKVPDLLPEQGRYSLQSLAEALLEYGFDNRSGFVPEVLRQLSEDCPGQQWLEYWLLRYLTEAVGEASQLNEIVGSEAGWLLVDKAPGNARNLQTFPRLAEQRNMLEKMLDIRDSTRELQSRGLTDE